MSEEKTLNTRNKEEKKKKKWLKRLLILLAVLCVLTVVGLAILPNFIMKDIMSGKFAQDLYDPADFGVEAQTLRLTTEDDMEIEAYLTEAVDPKGR